MGLKLSDLNHKEVEVIQSPPSRSLGDKATAAIEGFGNANTAGLLPYISGELASLTRSPTEDVDNQLKSKGFTIDQPDWNSSQDQAAENRLMLARHAKEMPEQFYGGELAATLLPGAAGAKSAAPVAYSLAKKAVSSGLLGGAAKAGIYIKALDMLRGSLAGK